MSQDNQSGSNLPELTEDEAITNSALSYFKDFCASQGMDDGDVRACTWHKEGMIDFIKWIIEQPHPAIKSLEAQIKELREVSQPQPDKDLVEEIREVILSLPLKEDSSFRHRVEWRADATKAVAAICQSRIHTLEYALRQGASQWESMYNDEKRDKEKLQAFKDFVHRRLDEAGIPTHPDGEHSKAGCRIGDRLDLLTAENERLKEEKKSILEAISMGTDLESSINWEEVGKPELWTLRAENERLKEESQRHAILFARWILLHASTNITDEGFFNWKRPNGKEEDTADLYQEYLTYQQSKQDETYKPLS